MASESVPLSRIEILENSILVSFIFVPRAADPAHKGEQLQGKRDPSLCLDGGGRRRRGSNFPSPSTFLHFWWLTEFLLGFRQQMWIEVLLPFPAAVLSS